MKTTILTLLICCISLIKASAQVHVTPPAGAVCTTKPCIVDTTVTTKSGKTKKKNLMVKKENRDPADSSSDLVGSENRTLDRSDVNGGNDRDINRGQPTNK